MKKIFLQPALRGKISDLADNPVVAAQLVLSGPRLGEKLRTMTGNEGNFLFHLVPPGLYRLEVSCPGFSKLVQRGILVRDNAIAGLDLKMDFAENSREIMLRTMSLQYIDGILEVAEENESSQLNRQVERVLDGIQLERIHFKPPKTLHVGQIEKLEFGFFQNVKDDIVRRLLGLGISNFAREQIHVEVSADLRIAGCRLTAPQPMAVIVENARYVSWEWELLPQSAGLHFLSLIVKARIGFDRGADREITLLVLDREVLIKSSFFLKLKKNLRGWSSPL